MRQQSEAGQLSLSGSSLKKIFSSKKSINEMDRSSVRKVARDIFQVSVNIFLSSHKRIRKTKNFLNI